MAERRITTRFAVEGDREVRQRTQEMARDVDQNFEKVKQSGQKASVGLKAVDAAARDIRGSIEGMAGRLGPAGAALSALGPAGLAAAAGIAAITAAALPALREFAKVELSNTRLQAVLVATGGAARKSADDIIALADAMESRTLFDGEAIKDAAAALATFKSVSGSTFEDTLRLAADLSATFGTDLKGSAIQLGKALEDPIKGLTALRRVGVSFTEDQKELIKRLVESGNLLEAQTLILKTLEGQVGGVADAMGNTLSGAVNNLGDSFDNLLETFGGVINKGDRVTKFIREVTGSIADLSTAIDKVNQQPDKWYDKIPGFNLSPVGIAVNSNRLSDAVKDAEKERKDFELERDAAAAFARFENGPLNNQSNGSSSSGSGTAGRRPAKDIKEQKDRLAEFITELRKENELMVLSERERTVQTEILKAENLAREQGTKLTQAQREEIRKLTEGQFDHAKATEATKKAAEDAQKVQAEYAQAMAQPWIHATENVQDALAQMLVDGKFSMDSLLSIGKRAAAEFVAAWAIRPLLNSVIGGIGGFAMGGVSGGSGTASGGVGVSDVISGATGIAGQIGAVTGAINAWGASALPSLFGVAAGPTLSGAAGYGTGLLSGAGIGLSSIALPVAGLALGALASSVFGGSRPHPASTFGTQGLNFRNARLLSKHMDTSTASGMAGNLQQALSALQGAGLNLDFIQGLQGGVDDGTGFYSFGDWSQRNPLDTVTFDPNDADNGLARFVKLVFDASQASNNLSNIMDADLIPAMRELSTEGKTGAEVVQALVDALTRDDQRKAFLTGLDNNFLSAALPGYGQRLQLEQEYAAALQRANELGVDAAGIARIQERHQLSVKMLLEQNNEAQREQIEGARELVNRYGRVASTLSGFIDELNYGQYASGAPRDVLSNLRGELLSLEGRTDAASQERLTALLPRFLQLSGPSNGFNDEYRRDQEIARRLAEGTKTSAERQLSVQQSILKEAQSTNQLLAQYLGISTGNANDKLVAALQGGYTGLSGQQIDSIFGSAGVTVTPGQGRRTAFLNEAGNAAINDRLNAVFRALGVPGFATGGIVRGAGGIDTNLARLTSGEGVLNVQAMRRIGERNFHYLNETGRLPNHDGQAMLAKMDAMIARLEGLMNVSAAGHTQTVETMEGVKSELSQIRRTARLEAAAR